MGRGVAYAAHEFPYLLNVPAARSSAVSREPLQFLHFAQARVPNVDGEDFLPRALYGEYLQELLFSAERDARPNVRLRRVHGEVTGILQTDGAAPLAAQFADRAPIVGHVVILALGNPPAPLPPWAEALRGHPAFRQDPRDLPETLTADQSVLIVGNGLTMADAASLLSRHPDRIPTLHTISRRGLIPKTQTEFHADAMRGSGETLLASTHSLRQAAARLPGPGPRGRESGRRLARSRLVHSQSRAGAVASAAADGAAPLCAPPAGALGHLPAPSAAAAIRAHRAPSAQRQIADTCGPHSGRGGGAGRVARLVAAARQQGDSRDDRGHGGQCHRAQLQHRTLRGSAHELAAVVRVDLAGCAQSGFTQRAIWGLREPAGARQPAALLSGALAAGRASGRDRGR